MILLNIILLILFCIPVMLVWNGFKGQKFKDPLIVKIKRALIALLIESITLTIITILIIG